MTFEQDREPRRARGTREEADTVAALLNLWSLRQSPKTDDLDTDQIFAAIETEIIPRLILANDNSGRRACLPRIAPLSITPQEQASFVEALLRDSADDAHRLADRLIARGVPVEVVFLDLFAWSARRLGEFWDEDACSFSDVTIGLCRLHEAVHRLHDVQDPPRAKQALSAPSILIGNAPGEQHVFGAVMVADFFRRNGWSVHCEPGTGPAALCRLAAEKRFDVIGISVTTDSTSSEVTALIRSLRAVSRNAGVRIIAGGQVFTQDPALADRIGADAVALDGLSAPELARNLLAIS